MRKRRTLAKRMNALLSAFVFFIGVFFLSGFGSFASSSVSYPMNQHLDSFYLYIMGKPFKSGNTIQAVSVSVSSTSGSDAVLDTSSGQMIRHGEYYTVRIPLRVNINPTFFGNGEHHLTGRCLFGFGYSITSNLAGSDITSDFYVSDFVMYDSFGNRCGVDYSEEQKYYGFFPPQDRTFALSLQNTVYLGYIEFTGSSSSLSSSSYDVPGVSIRFTLSGSFYTFANSSLVLWSGPYVAPDDSYLADIDNQTAQTNDKLDTLTDGYNSDSGSAAADSFGQGVSEYDQAEGSLFDSASTSIGDFSFISLDSVPAVTTSISFVSSIMTMIFDQSGGLTGAGIVMSISLCALIGSIVVGIYRYWHKDG